MCLHRLLKYPFARFQYTFLYFSLYSGLHTLLNVNIRTISYVYSPDAVFQKHDLFYQKLKMPITMPSAHQLPFILTSSLDVDLINVVLSQGMCLYQVIMTLHFLMTSH